MNWGSPGGAQVSLSGRGRLEERGGFRGRGAVSALTLQAGHPGGRCWGIQDPQVGPAGRGHPVYLERGRRALGGGSGPGVGWGAGSGQGLRGLRTEEECPSGRRLEDGGKGDPGGLFGDRDGQAAV